LIAKFMDTYGVEVRHGWGMSNLCRADRLRAAAEQHAIVAKQGKTVSGIEIKIVERYDKAEKTALVDGWFPTGDIATIDLENAAIGHPAVAMADVIGVKHPKWRSGGCPTM
jgi:long-subunit acyl-CoA synthetase (AMP-forming)